MAASNDPVQSTPYVDWRPFDYFTARTSTPAAGAFVANRPAIETIEFLPIGEKGTRVVMRIRLVKRGRIALFVLKTSRPAWASFWKRSFAALLSIIKEDADKLGEPAKALTS